MTPEGEPGDPVETVRRHLAEGSFQDFMNIAFVSAERDKRELVLRLAYKDAFERTPGSRQWHGGVISAFIDIAGDFVLMLVLGRGTPTINLRIDFLRPAVDTDLTATARIVRSGRSIGLADIELTDSQGRSIAVGRGCYSTLQA